MRFFLPTFLTVFIGVAVSLCLVPAVRAADQFVKTITDPWIPRFSHEAYTAGKTVYETTDGGNLIDLFPNLDANSVLVVNHHLTLDGSITIDTIVIEKGGFLEFDTATNTRLEVVTVEVLAGGKLHIGTERNPIADHVTATMLIRDVPWDLSTDPGQYGHGLLALDGSEVRIHGRELSETFVRLAGEVRAGERTLVLKNAVTGWKVGDELIFPDSKQYKSKSSADRAINWEKLKIAGISKDGKIITLDSALQFDHLGARNGDDVLEFFPHISNMSRNVVIKSENPSILLDENGLSRRGHTLYNSRADIDIRYANFDSLGRTTTNPLDNTTWDADGNVTHIGKNQIARYPVHFHYLIGPNTPQTNSYQFTFIGNSVCDDLPEHDFRWGITIHGSHYGLVQDNLLFNWNGVGIVLEDGSETGNVIEGNFIVGIDGLRGRGDESPGNHGSGIWAKGVNNYIRGNVVANVNEYAYNYMLWSKRLGSIRIPAYQGADPMIEGQYNTVDMRTLGIREFSGNEAYGVRHGMTIWGVGSVKGTMALKSQHSVIKDMKMWHVGKNGLFGYGMSNVTFDGWVQRGDRSLLAPNVNSKPTGLFFGDYVAIDIVIENADIQGLRYGIEVAHKVGNIADVFGHVPGITVIKNSFLRNSVNILVGTLYGATGGGTGLEPREVYVDNVRFDSVTGATGNQFNILRSYHTSGSGNRNIMQDDNVYVRNYNGVAGDDFQVFYLEQHPNFVPPESHRSLVGSPEAGLTNQQLWDKYEVAVAGAVAPCLDDTTRPEIYGFTCPIPASRVVYGDADGNGSFGPEDLNEVVDWLVGNETMPPVGSPTFIAADVDGDGAITPADLNLLVDRLIGRIDKFPVEG